jgi:hypothetical protein
LGKWLLRRLGAFVQILENQSLLNICSKHPTSTSGPASLATEATTMATRLYTQAHWSAEDDQMLRSMAEAGKSLTLMTVKLKKPMNSIRSRAQALQINIPGTNIGRKRRC